AQPQEPLLVLEGPVRATPPDLAMAQQERPEPAPCPVEIDDHVPARPAQIAHRLLLGARDPDGDELPGAGRARKPAAVTPVSLHPVAGCLRDQRWRHHVTRDLE